MQVNINLQRLRELFGKDSVTVSYSLPKGYDEAHPAMRGMRTPFELVHSIGIDVTLTAGAGMFEGAIPEMSKAVAEACTADAQTPIWNAMRAAALKAIVQNVVLQQD